jgi:hypothetical protein
VGFADVVEEPFAAAEEHRRDGEVQLVEQARREVLPHRRGPATQSTSAPPAAACARSRAAPMPSVTKWKLVPPGHGHGVVGMVGEHEDVVVERGFFAPRPPSGARRERASGGGREVLTP